MVLKKPFLVAMAFIAVIAFTSCDNEDNGSSYPDFYVKFMLDGTNYSYEKGFSDYGPTPFGNLVTGTPDTTWILATPDGPALADPDDLISIGFEPTVIGNHYAGDVILIINGTNYYDVSVELSVIGYGNVGGVIAGTFAGTVTGGLSISGTFRVKRIDEGWGPG